MINKRGVWFMTLFSLIIALSVYYVTVPSDKIIDNKPVIKNEESTILTALRVEADKEMESMMNDLRLILSSIESSSEEKNMKKCLNTMFKRFIICIIILILPLLINMIIGWTTLNDLTACL